MESRLKKGDKVVFIGQPYDYPYDVPPYKEEGYFIFHMTNQSGIFDFPNWGVRVHLWFDDIQIKSNSLKPDQIEKVLSMVEQEGIEHVFLHKTEFEDFEDNEFHAKRRAFISEYNKFENYLNSLRNESCNI